MFLEGKVAIVTGAGTGIGRACALALAREGAELVACGRRREPLQKLQQSIEESTGGSRRARIVQADVSLEPDVQKVVKATLDLYGAIDILINNAGIAGGTLVHEMDVETWDRVMGVNLRGPFLMARAVLPVLRNRRSGHIINISSESGLEYYPGDGAYGLSKHALNDLGEYIQRENQDYNIRVDAICPGMVVTEMTRSSPGLHLEKCLYPEDIADLVIWLLSRRPNIKIGTPILIQTMENPWEG